ncbi:MAG: hypothetical protein L3J07_04630 [Candidatus Magasanikbacteria bacterium]|nr:hypothetical protein [Candidatus Magasanikbacteria bacterium]
MESIKIFASQINPNIDTIDLHTENSLYASMEKLDQKLYSLYQDEKEYCRIIFGIGTGKLKNETLKSLEKNPLIEHVEMDENGGSCIVFFS